MGDTLSTEIVELQCLSESVDAYCRRAAEAIGCADVMLLCTGAGFSADSGLATFKDIARVEAYCKSGLRYQDLCRPALLLSDPELFYGFWGSCFNAYRTTQPHGGYEILKKWRDDRFLRNKVSQDIQRYTRKNRVPQARSSSSVTHRSEAGAFFLATSNIDSHSFDFFAECEVRECHGSLEVWQCGAEAPCCRETWHAPAELEFAIDNVTMRAEARSRDKFDKKQRLLSQRRLSFLSQDSKPQSRFTYSSDKNWPCCPSCGELARPAVLMFDDLNWVPQCGSEDRHAAWHAAVINCGRAWKRRAKKNLRVVILEIGCGMDVTKMRQASEDAAEDFAKVGFDVSLVRVNPEHPNIDSQLPGVQHIPLCCNGLEALQRIESLFLFEPHGRWNGFNSEDMDSRSTQYSESSDSDASTDEPSQQDSGSDARYISASISSKKLLHHASGIKRSFPSQEESDQSLMAKRSR